MRITFQAGQSRGIDAVYHFTFTGDEPATATVTIRDQRLTVEEGHIGRPDCAITADSATWVGFLRREKSLLWALLRRRIRVRGKFRLLPAFGRCFPS
jgi:putative sterol carrier protein